MLDDIVLIARVKMFCDTRAFDKLVVKYQQPVRRFFLNLTLGDTALSDDLAQDTFLKAYTCLTRFQGRSRFSTWLFRIAYNVYYDYRRHCRPTDNLDGCETMRIESRPSSVAERTDIYSALSRLSDTERTCVTLQLMEELSIDRISLVTGLAQGTVKSHLFRGKQKLANYLRNNGYGEYGKR